MFNNTPWLEEQLNQERRREMERHAEEERATQTDATQSAWKWLQRRAR